jgi:acyl-CoA synthetase (AMP-forming)/AMP-acid ligase II
MTAQRYEAHHGRMVRCYAERFATVDLAFRAAVASSPAAVAVVDGDRSVSYRELDDLVDKAGRGLLGSGVAQGDRIAVMLANSLEVAIAVLATARIGAVLVPIGTRLRRPEIEHMLHDSAATALIFDAAFEGELPPPTDGLPPHDRRFRVGDGAGASLPFAALLADPRRWRRLRSPRTTSSASFTPRARRAGPRARC